MLSADVTKPVNLFLVFGSYTCHVAFDSSFCFGNQLVIKSAVEGRGTQSQRKHMYVNKAAAFQQWLAGQTV